MAIRDHGCRDNCSARRRYTPQPIVRPSGAVTAALLRTPARGNVATREELLKVGATITVALEREGGELPQQQPRVHVHCS